jgi:cytoskeletal protein CcmA (bactofilin family)
MLFNKKIEEHAPSLPGGARPDAMPPRSDHPRPAKPRAAQSRSVIDPGLVITGTLEGDGELQIDGHVLGDVRCTHLTVGKDASIDGNIAADEVVVRGRVKGAIGANRVLLTDGARVESDIFHKRLAIEDGAQFHGVSRPKDCPIDELHAMAAEMRGVGSTKAAEESDTTFAGA